jgi:hypothetical protein
MTTKLKLLMMIVVVALMMGSQGTNLALAQEEPVNPPTAIFTNWQSGNAGFECSQIGDYTYALKYNEADGGDEGALNGTETATFTDEEGNTVHSNTITISNSNGKVFDWNSAPNGIGAVIVKAGTVANVWFYDPQVKSDTGLYAYQDRNIGHITFCWNLDYVAPGEWCSPGYWRQSHHLDSWPTTISPDDAFSGTVTLSKQGQRAGATSSPTLWQVLQSPQYYGGDAFNAVGDLLSGAHPNVNFLGERVEDSCPLN